jgi:hypothetical protein
MSEIPSSPEDKDVVRDLPAELGFIESEELMGLRGQIREAETMGDEERTRELVIQYALGGEKIVNQKQGEDFPKAQIGLIIAKALVRKEAGRVDYYSSDLYDALTYAEGMGYVEVAEALRNALDKLGSPLIVPVSEIAIMSHEENKTPSQKIAGILREFGEELGFDSETCDEIAVMPFDEAFETAYGYVTQADLDADEVLADFIEEPKESDSEL